jgi:hypothetical protein
MIEKLERTLDEVETDLSNESDSSESKGQPKKVKKVAKAKKVAKKVAKKAEKSAKKDTDGLIKLADLASEAKITAASARRKLRDAELNREGRWAWEEGSKDLKEARKVLGLDA